MRLFLGPDGKGMCDCDEVDMLQISVSEVWLVVGGLNQVGHYCDIVRAGSDTRESVTRSLHQPSVKGDRY